MFASMTDEELCRASGEGREAAFVELVRRYQSAVCAVTYSATGRRDLSEDLAQETFVVAWKKLPGIEAPARVGGWLAGIARNLGRKTHRRAPVDRLVESDSVPTDDPNVEEAMAERETRVELWRLLSALPLRYREAMVLYYREEKSARRVSHQLGITVAATEQRLSRGRRMLRERLDRALEREIERSRPSEDFTRRVAAVLPVLGPGMIPGGEQLVGNVAKGLMMKKLLTVALTVVALVVATYSVLALVRTDSGAEASDSAADEASRPRVSRSEIVDDAPGSAAGQVIEAETSKPVAGATVIIGKPGGGAGLVRESGEPARLAVVRTRDDGSWTIAGLDPGRYVATATAPGHLPGKRAAFRIGRDTETGGLSIELARGGHAVSGVVSDIGGGAVAGAVVRARVRSGPFYAAMSDHEGRYRLNVPNGVYSMSAWEADYRGSSTRVTVQGKRVVDFELVPGAAILGRVVLRGTGTPVAGARVSFARMIRIPGGFSSDRSGDDEMAITDQNGRFALRRLEAAEYQLSAAGDRVASLAPAEVAIGIAEQVSDVVVTVDPAANARGRVVDKADNTVGIADAEVGAFAVATGAQMKTRTGPDGTFELKGMAPGTYPLVVSGEGMIPSMLEASVTVAAEDRDDILVEVERGTTITGRIRPPQAADVKLELRNSRGGLEVMISGQKVANAHVRSGEDGAFTLGSVPVGDWKVVAEGPDGSLGTVEVSVADGGLEDVVVDLDPRPSLRGVLVYNSGGPIGDATVRLQKDVDGANETAAFFAQKSALSATTDDEGRFEMVGLEAGDYRLTAADRSGARLMRDSSRPDDPGLAVAIAQTPVDGVELVVERPDGVVEGIVRGPDGGPYPDAWVTLQPEADDGFDDGYPPVLSDADGRFSFRHLPPGTHGLHANSKRGDAVATLDGVAVGDRVELKLKELGSIAGRVMARGNPVTRFEVKTARLFDRKFVSEDGRFEIGRVGTGERVLVVTAEEGSATQRVAVRAGEQIEVEVELGGWGGISGRVVRANGEPAAGLHVMARARGGDRDRGIRLASLFSGGSGPTTDAEGRFTVEGLGPGRGTVSFGGGSALSNRTLLGSANFFVEPERTTDLGDIRVLGDDTVSEQERGTLGVRVEASFDPPRGPEGIEQIDAPSGPARLWIGNVEPSGPASGEGLDVGQEVLSLDGQAVEQLGAGTVAQLFRPARLQGGRTYGLVVATDSGPRHVAITAAARPAP